jgi:hypothetical protein
MLNPIILGDLSDVDVSEHENKAIQDGFIHLKVYVYPSPPTVVPIAHRLS